MIRLWHGRTPRGFAPGSLPAFYATYVRAGADTTVLVRTLPRKRVSWVHRSTYRHTKETPSNFRQIPPVHRAGVRSLIIASVAGASFVTNFLGAPLVRILPGLAAICRAKDWIFFIFRACERTLDQHIGVRIPGGQASIIQYLC
jgi:hypothetical protein